MTHDFFRLGRTALNEEQGRLALEARVFPVLQHLPEPGDVGDGRAGVCSSAAQEQPEGEQNGLNAGHAAIPPRSQGLARLRQRRGEHNGMPYPRQPRLAETAPPLIMGRLLLCSPLWSLGGSVLFFGKTYLPARMAKSQKLTAISLINSY